MCTDFLREGDTWTLKPVRTWQADIISVALRIWHPLVRCRSGVQDYGFVWETTSGNVPAFSACWFDSGYKFAPVYGALVFRAMLGWTVDTNFCVSLQSSRISAQCLVRQRIHAHASHYGGNRVELAVLASGMCMAGLLVTLHLALCSLVCRNTAGFAGDDAHHDRLSLLSAVAQHPVSFRTRMLTCPLWCSTDARFRRAENCGAPQLQFVDQVETSLLDNRD